MSFVTTFSCLILFLTVAGYPGACTPNSKIRASSNSSGVMSNSTAEQGVSQVVTRDVVVVGGGASGAHAAVKLKDMGKTVAVIDRQGKLGGHTETYWDPATGSPTNMGVQGWITYKNATDFISRMNVSTKALTHTTLTTKYVDFSTGEAADGYIAPIEEEWFGALETYYTVCQKYEDMILPGYLDFPDPDDIPEDLTLPFRDFVTKYNLTAGVPKLFELTGMGVGNMMDTTTMYVMQANGAPFVGVYFGEADSIVPSSGNVHEIYDKIGDFLGEDVLYNTTVMSSVRGSSNNGVQIIAQSADGHKTQINAQRLLIAIEPSEENMAPFDLDDAESSVFSKFEYSNVYVGAVKNPSLPANVSLTNIPISAVPSNWTSLPMPSFNSRFDDFGQETDLFRFLMVGTADLDPQGAHELVLDGFDKMVNTGVLDQTNGSSLEFAAFENHGAMHFRVGPDDIKAGFIQDQYALQGHRSTWYTGAAWSSQFTTVVWALNDVLLPKMVEGM